ncbi:hypothetical protein NSMM_900020 [Nitrosomonas mobilis]|uniref:Uncharacterized protein n=1 Tax=Nitrosomonas mobilis TaxID=51642 RepID=A0A1G5SKU5_9PROT|nr:hypothetical protein NSMM_900020 [Nitrosomonas mobilis]
MTLFYHKAEGSGPSGVEGFPHATNANTIATLIISLIPMFTSSYF